MDLKVVRRGKLYLLEEEEVDGDADLPSDTAPDGVGLRPGQLCEAVDSGEGGQSLRIELRCQLNQNPA